MFKFLKESKKEFEHVVRPTTKETWKYFNSVVYLIIFLTIFLFIVSTTFSTVLFKSKELINPAKITTNNKTGGDIDMNSLLGSGSTGSIDLSGMTVTPEVKNTSSDTAIQPEVKVSTGEVK